jgi:hypothetical protein
LEENADGLRIRRNICAKNVGKITAQDNEKEKNDGE